MRGFFRFLGSFMPYTQDQLLAAQVRGAHAVWARNIHEPERGEVSREITRIWDGVPFWRDWLRDPKGGGCPDGYTRPPDPDYCGVFAAYVARHIGDWLEDGQCVNVVLAQGIAVYCMSSPDRLASHAKWEQAGFERPGPLDPAGILGGHIVTVRPTKLRPLGSHIVIAADAPDAAGEFPTYEANAVGIRADGSRGHGVVIRARNIRDVARVWELGPEHFTGAAK